MRGIKRLKILLALTIILITASSANAAPQGTLIKGGVLTYPAGPYLKENPLLINLENYTVDGNRQILDEPVKVTCPEKESRIFDNNNQYATFENLNAWKSLIFPSNLYFIFIINLMWE